MKLFNLITEGDLNPQYKKILRLMNREVIAPHDKDIWEFLSDTLQIKDLKTKSELMFIYKKIYGEDEEVFLNLTDSYLEGIEDVSGYEPEQIALSIYLDVPPSLIVDSGYDHYGLNVYENLDSSGDQYAIGDDSQVSDAMESYFDGYVDNMGGLDYIDRWVLDDFIELDDYSIEQFAEEDAENRVDSMDDDEVIEEAGYDSRESYEDRISSLEEEISDFESQKEDLETELSDLEYENDEGDYDEEIEELTEKISDIEYEISDLESRKEDLESELEDLFDTAKTELIERYKDDIIDDINREGIDYFIDNMGISLSDAVDYYGHIDIYALESHLAETEDRGGSLGSYDGTEIEQFYSDEWYYIYQVN